MKLNTRINSRGGDLKDHQPDLAFSDRAVSKEELHRLLFQSERVAVPEKRGFWAVWTGKFSQWMSAMFWNKVPIGYEDESGFHYGSCPPHKDTHAACD